MADSVPHIDLGLTASGAPVAIVGASGTEARDMATLLRLAPGIALPGHAGDAALLVNYLARGNAYQVINDPQTFEQGYGNRLAAEDPAAPFREGARRLRDFGVPDFAQIKPPAFEGPGLVFYAVDRALGIPYRVTAADLSAAPQYMPVPMTPLPRPARPVAEPQLKPKTPAERAFWDPVKPGDLPE